MLMNPIRQPLVRTILVFVALAAVQLPAHANQILWQSGKNLRIKLVDQEDDAKKPNDQPVKLNARDITDALMSFRIWNKHYLKSDEVNRLFSVGQAQTLGQYLAQGLRKARPDQDITFVLAKQHVGFLNETTTQYMAGRVFYVDGKLNLIIGDYNRPADRFKERAIASTGGDPDIMYVFDHGSRGSSSGFKKDVITKDGINTHDGRRDWFEVDVPKAAHAYLAEQQQLQQKQQSDNAGANSGSAALQQQAASMARQNREMRLELARMRKEMAEQPKGSQSVEERLKTLESLKKKGLITDEEYNNKRKEILNNL